MSTEAPTVTWETLRLALSQWHAERDRALGRRVFTFVEEELRLMVPPLVKRTWPPDLAEDVLRSILAELIERPLKDDVRALRPYFQRLVRNRFIDGYRKRRRRAEEPLTEVDERPEDERSAPTPFDVAVRASDVARVRAALEQLGMADRVAIKLVEAPEWLEDDELTWLARQAGRSVIEVQEAIIAAADDVHALTRLFDPGDDDPGDAQARRRRLDRFRRRRDRAVEKFRSSRGEDAP